MVMRTYGSDMSSFYRVPICFVIIGIFVKDFTFTNSEYTYVLYIQDYSRILSDSVY